MANFLESVKGISLSRRCHFSAAHTYEVSQFSPEKNREIYGDLYVEAGFGHNFILEVQVTGEFHQESGMVCDLGFLDACLKQVTDVYDHRYLNEDIPVFKGKKVPTPENLCIEIYKALETLLLPKKTHIHSVRLYEGDRFWCEYGGEDEICIVTQKVLISCLHRHHNPDLSDEENEELYMKCSKVHGHEYQVELSVKGAVDPVTGMAFSRPQLNKLLEEKIVKVFHGKFLNEFLGNTSGEIILQKFEDYLRPEFSSEVFYGLRVRETRKNHFSTLMASQRIGEAI